MKIFVVKPLVLGNQVFLGNDAFVIAIRPYNLSMDDIGMFILKTAYMAFLNYVYLGNFIHLKLRVAVARRNLKWVNISNLHFKGDLSPLT